MEEKLARFAALLLERNRDVNLTAAGSAEELRARHIEDALAGLPVLDAAFEAMGGEAPRVIDVGAGAGLPGLVLAIARPAWRVTLVEATGKKSAFQREAAGALELANAEPVQARAEELAHDAAFREAFDAGVCRAVASLAVGVELVMPFVRVGGCGVFWKGPGLGDERAEGELACEVVGARLGDAAEYAAGGSEAERFYLAQVAKTAPTPEKYPRRPSRYGRKPYRA